MLQDLPGRTPIQRLGRNRTGCNRRDFTSLMTGASTRPPLVCGNSPQDPLASIHLGQPWPWGRKPPRGELLLAAPSASRLELLLFRDGNASQLGSGELSSQHHRSGDIWHVEVEGIGIGCCYAYRVFGPPTGATRVQPPKLLLDPCARAITGWDVYQRTDALGGMPNTAKCSRGGDRARSL